MLRKMQTMVFGVNMDSLRSHHVRAGNTRYDVPNPINLTAHTSPLSPSYVNLDA